MSDRLRTLSFVRQPGSPGLVAYIAQLRVTLERALGATRQRFGAQAAALEAHDVLSLIQAIG